MKIKFLLLFITGTLLAGCASQNNESSSDAVADETTELGTRYSADKGGILLYEADLATEYPNAKLTLKSTIEDAVADSNLFEFEVSDYDLAIQTIGAGERNCANSGSGQHIHFIVNNEPYKAKYTASFKETLGEGTNVVLAFLSRSYHESIKSKDAFVLTEFNTTESSAGKSLDKEELLFYSRPKGNYTTKEGSRILLDFYLVNTDLSPNGNKVRATINGNEFILTKWAPYFIEGFPLGENTVRIELIDANGALVPGRFNDSGVRTFTLTEG